MGLGCAAVEQTMLGSKPSTGCFTPVRPRLIAPPSAAVEQTTLPSAAVEQTALGSAAVKQTAPGDKPSTGCSRPVRPRLTTLGDKPGTVCSTPVRPRLVEPPNAAVEQTTLPSAAVKQTALGANLAPAVCYSNLPASSNARMIRGSARRSSPVKNSDSGYPSCIRRGRLAVAGRTSMTMPW